MLKKTLFLCGALVIAGNSFAAEKKIEAIYNKLATLSKKKDIAGLKKLWKDNADPKATLEMGGRKMTGNEFMATFESSFSVVGKFKKCDIKVLKQVVTGNKYVLTVMSDQEFESPSLDGKKKNALWKGISYSTDIWIKTAQGFKIQSIKYTKENYTIDGKPMKM